MNEFLQLAAEWVVANEVPNLKGPVEKAIEEINAQCCLDGKTKILVGFVLFAYCMHKGPLTFMQAEKTATELGVLNEMLEYAEDWIAHSKEIEQNTIRQH